MDSFAKEGLRTLLLAQKKLTVEEYSSWDRLYCKA